MQLINTLTYKYWFIYSDTLSTTLANAWCHGWLGLLSHNASPCQTTVTFPANSTATATWPVLISHPTKNRRLSWPKGWYQDVYTLMCSPISLLTGLNVEQLTATPSDSILICESMTTPWREQRVNTPWRHWCLCRCRWEVSTQPHQRPQPLHLSHCNVNLYMRLVNTFSLQRLIQDKQNKQINLRLFIKINQLLLRECHNIAVSVI